MQVQFDITNKCNLRCLHCYNESGENCITTNELTDNEILLLTRDLIKLQPYNVCFCGGETLIRKAILVKALRLLTDNNINCSLVTNGILFDKETMDELTANGLTRIQFSLDGVNAEHHEMLRLKKGAYESVIKAIRLASESKKFIEVMVSFCPFKYNINDLKGVADLCKSLGVTQVRLQPLMNIGRANKNIEAIMPADDDYRLLVKDVYDIQVKYGPSYIMWGDPIDHIIRFREYMKNCVNIANVRANGDIVASPYLPVILGNIRKHSLKEYWDAGLAAVWQLEIVQKYAKQINSIKDLTIKKDGYAKIWQDEDETYDIIEKGGCFINE
jgi:MoaA/NifB/PqqE/SkfB family radical SAM enzyme